MEEQVPASSDIRTQRYRKVGPLQQGECPAGAQTSGQDRQIWRRPIAQQQAALQQRLYAGVIIRALHINYPT